MVRWYLVWWILMAGNWKPTTFTAPLGTGRISCFVEVFCILCFVSIVVVDQSQNRLEICVLNFVSFFCPATKHKIETKFTHNFVVWNTKHEIRPVLYFVVCRPLGRSIWSDEIREVGAKKLAPGSDFFISLPLATPHNCTIQLYSNKHHRITVLTVLIVWYQLRK